MTILVSDTSVLIDLERGELIPCAFKLSATFSVPDVLYERELRDYGGEDLVKLGNFTGVLKESPFIRAAGYLDEKLRYVLAGTPNAFDGAIIRSNSIQARS